MLNRCIPCFRTGLLITLTSLNWVSVFLADLYYRLIYTFWNYFCHIFHNVVFIFAVKLCAVSCILEISLYYIAVFDRIFSLLLSLLNTASYMFTKIYFMYTVIRRQRISHCEQCTSFDKFISNLGHSCPWWSPTDQDDNCGAQPSTLKVPSPR